MALQLTGRYFVRLFGPDGVLKDTRQGQNIVTTNGKEALASYLGTAASTATTNTFKYISVGTGTQTPTATDIGMTSELTRQTGTVSYVSGAVYQVSCSFVTGSAAGNVTEFGLFNTNTGGTLFSHDLETTMTVGTTDVLQVVYDLVLS